MRNKPDTVTDRQAFDTTCRDSYERNGYLIIKGALSSAETELVLDVIDATVSRLQMNGSFPARYMEGEYTVRIRNAIAQAPQLALLLDHAQIFPHILELIGPYLQLVGSEIFVRRASVQPLMRFHTDGGAALQQIAVDHAARALQLKVQYFLTDLSLPDCGNFLLVKGSHRRRPSKSLPGCYVPEANESFDSGALPPDSIQILAEPGDALIFPYSLWHAVAPNRSGRERKSVILRFGHLWHRPFDHGHVEEEVLRQLSPRQRRILGDLGPSPNPKEFYKPPQQLELMGLSGSSDTPRDPIEKPRLGYARRVSGRRAEEL
jgi:phytanoyl-CoA hydroxylase